MRGMSVALLGGLLFAAGPPPAMGADAAAPGPVDFVRDVQPILAAHCHDCHGPDAQESGLRLHERKAAFNGGDGGRVITPGAAEKSPLFRYVAGLDADIVMPPQGEGERLSAEQVELLRRWIDGGASWPETADQELGVTTSDHWAYQPLKRPAPPAVSDLAWLRNGLDAFVLAKLDAEGLRPAPEADRARLVRRVTLDLTGLPPTIEEVDAFLADERPDAYERVVDRLLESDGYGERWARWWLDLARYADTQGYEKDNRRSIWLYRDWVIDAFNRDLPFDRFTIEQLAGDLLPDATLAQRVATGFHRNTMVNTEGGTDDEEFRTAAVVDRVNTTMTVWMGVTMACAQCHSHKYDPFTQREYFQLYAFFNNTADHDTPDESPVVEVAEPGVFQRRAELKAKIAALEKAPAVKQPALGAAPAIQFTIEYLKRAVPRPPTTPVLEELAEPRETRIHVRGNFLSLGDPVTPGVPAVLPPLRDDASQNRLALAEWLVAKENPLTARVTVNRIWEQYFGQGVVATTEDFGTQGEPPTHPAMLDWLAVECMESGWSMKALHRTIVTSAVYRQDSRVSTAAAERDPQNRLLARGPRARLSAEAIRDQALAAAGLLSRRMHGESVMPPQPEGVWQVVYSGDQWRTSENEDRHRRGLYTFWRRTSPYPSMVTFDAPSREFCVERRSRTNTPLQALVLLNDPVYVEAAVALARRVTEHHEADLSARVAYAFRRCLARRPTDEELRRLVILFGEQLAHFAGDPSAALALTGEAESGDLQAARTAELAAWTVVANVLLNLDEMITKG